MFSKSIIGNQAKYRTVLYRSIIKMLTMSKEKTKNNERVIFLQGTENDIPLVAQFDCVVTHFYLDQFSDEELNSVLQKIKKSLAPSATWIATDFVQQTWWHSLMLRAMYLFFQATCNLATNRLPNWNDALRKHNGQKIASKFFYRGFIEATLYQF